MRTELLAYVQAHPGCTAVDMLLADVAGGGGTLRYLQPLRDLEAEGAIRRTPAPGSAHVEAFPGAHGPTAHLCSDQAARWYPAT